MTTPNQKADVRPISFVFHNAAEGKPPIEVRLVIRPEDLTRSDRSRLSVTQTLGGAWADNFGRGVPQVNISGHTGWGQGMLPNGQKEFQNLFDTVFKRWHEDRAKVLKNGLDPEKVRLIFSDSLDDFTWVMAPQTFKLKRSRTRPLLSQYEIAMTLVSYDASEGGSLLSTLTGHDASGPWRSALADLGLESLDDSIRKIESFAASSSSMIDEVLGNAGKPFKDMVDVTGTVLKTTSRVINADLGMTGTAASGLISIAGNLARAATNVTRTIQSIKNIPDMFQAQVSAVASAFHNAFCVLRNVFRDRKFLGDYDSLYGASTCSSTAGGRPISSFATANPFSDMFNRHRPDVRLTPDASNAIRQTIDSDPVLSPMNISETKDRMEAIVSGVVAS